MATLLDTTMELLEPPNNDVEPETDTQGEPEDGATPDDEEDEDFRFDAPSYYDLKNPALERRYVNNADGYFSSPAPSAATSKSSPFTAEPPSAPAKKRADSAGKTAGNTARTLASSYEESINNHDEQQQTRLADNNHHVEADGDEHMELEETATLDTTMAMAEDEEEKEEEDALSLSRSRLLEDRPETFEEVFRQYASSSQSSATSSYLLHELDTSVHSSSSHQQLSPHGSQTSSSSAAPRAGRRSPEFGQDSGPRSAKARFAGNGVPSKLMQPTQSYLRRLQAEQQLRERSYMDDVPVEEKPHRVTRPRSPKMHSRARPVNPNDPSRMSSTSRELLKIQEERLLLQMEKLKIREFHEKTKVQRPPANVHQRSVKQLTIPQSPHLQVESRTRRFPPSASEGSADSSFDSESSREAPRPPIPAETLLSRDYALPLPPHSRENRHALTQTAQSPQLQTAARAASRPGFSAPLSQEREKPAAPDYSRMKVGGLTQPMTPQLATSRRAAYHRPIDVVDHDAEELAKKFHARPISRGVLEPKSYTRASPAKSEGKARLTQPMPPNLATSARSVTRQSAFERAAAVTAEMERRRKEREEQRAKARQAAQSNQHQSIPRPARRPVVPETPPLKSIQLHREYQDNFRRRVEAEEQEKERLHQFRANPMRVTSAPARFEGSTKPLTEVMPFSLPGERYHEEAQERLKQRRREEEKQAKAAGIFRAKPMPVYDGEDQDGRSFQVKASDKPLTQFAAPALASDRRAAERAAFDAAERERREREESYREQKEEEQRRLEEEEIKRLRRERLVFHARPVPDAKPFQLKPDDKPLTEPKSPIRHFQAPRSDGSIRE
ncbi:hypothetical protein BBJ28_00011624 [Nothophytophthora sp. Chile5]|nr:hypothetical protein BBJ28_00011624 [Nothophytophthora sp. Chile5]